MSLRNATTASLLGAVEDLLLVSLSMERVLYELLPLLPKAKRESLDGEMLSIRDTLNHLVNSLDDETASDG